MNRDENFKRRKNTIVRKGLLQQALTCPYFHEFTLLQCVEHKLQRPATEDAARCRSVPAYMDWLDSDEERGEGAAEKRFRGFRKADLCI